MKQITLFDITENDNQFYPSEADLIEQIEKQPQKQTYIKRLIREDMAREKKE